MASFAIAATSTAQYDTPIQKRSGAAYDAMSVVRKQSDGTMVKAQANSLTNAGNGGELYLALSTAEGSGQPTLLMKDGVVTTTGLVQGETYALSPSLAGGICPVADLASTNAVVIVGVAKSATQLMVRFINSGVVK